MLEARAGKLEIAHTRLACTRYLLDTTQVLMEAGSQQLDTNSPETGRDSRTEETRRMLEAEANARADFNRRLSEYEDAQFFTCSCGLTLPGKILKEHLLHTRHKASMRILQEEDRTIRGKAPRSYQAQNLSELAKGQILTGLSQRKPRETADTIASTS